MPAAGFDFTNLARVISLECQHVRRRIKVVLQLKRNPEVVRQSRISLLFGDVLGQLVVRILPLGITFSDNPSNVWAALENTHLTVLTGHELDIAVNYKHGSRKPDLARPSAVDSTVMLVSDSDPKTVQHRPGYAGL